MNVTPPDAKLDGTLFGGATHWYQTQVIENQVMAILVISVSLDLSEDSVGPPARRVILFGTIPITIPDTTTISPFLSSAVDTIDSDTSDTPPSPTHGHPIPHGRPYRYHLNRPVHMMTVRKRVGPLPTHRLIVRHSVDYSFSDHFSSDDSSSDSSSETSLDSPMDALSDFASSRSSSDHSLPASPSGTRSSHRLCSLVPSVHRSSAIFERPSHDSSSASRSRKRSRSHVASIPLSSHTLWALSYTLADLLPSPKRIRSPETTMDLEDCSEDRFKPYVPREVGLGVDFEDESSEPSRSIGADLVMDVDVVRRDGIEIDLKIQAEIDECFAYANSLRDRGIDARVVVEVVDREESETGTRGPVEVRVERRFHDHTEAIPVHRIQAIEGVQRDQGRRIVGAEQQKMPNTRSGASRTREAVNEQSDRQIAEALRVRDAVRNLRPLMGDEVEQE
ncbi:hypothetical protein Tco_0143621 [Tanacetum coccineum]